MRFSVECPVDGQVTVGIGDISSVVVREGDQVEVAFECPRCGTHIHVSAQVPRVLLASLEEVMLQDETSGERRIRFVGGEIERLSPLPDADVPAADADEQARIDSYCEYFRRQLEPVATVEALLSEIDQK